MPIFKKKPELQHPKLTDLIVSNGNPSKESIMNLAKDIHIPSKTTEEFIFGKPDKVIRQIFVDGELQSEEDLDNMPKLQGKRDRRDWTFYDTVLSPESDRPLLTEEKIFDSPTNPDGSIFSSDQSTTINQIRASLFFDAAIHNPSLYAIIQMGCTFIPIIGGKETRPINLLHQFVDHEKDGTIKQRAWPAFEIFYQCGPIGIPPRQTFALKIISSKSTVKLINELQGKKYFKIHVDCVIMRDIC